GGDGALRPGAPGTRRLPGRDRADLSWGGQEFRLTPRRCHGRCLVARRTARAHRLGGAPAPHRDHSFQTEAPTAGFSLPEQTPTHTLHPTEGDPCPQLRSAVPRCSPMSAPPCCPARPTLPNATTWPTRPQRR